ncbi:MAG TPA: ANTAR domain-containing protein [Actinocrinis sp.]|nr:ANTAR domain-containing protein [Actinocrinis sp.]
MYGSEPFDLAFTQVDQIVAAARAAASTLAQLAESLGSGATADPGDANGSDGASEPWAALREENRQLREALDSRSAIERAKGILMGRFGYSEQQAFAVLAATARRRHRKVRMIASELLLGAYFPEIEQPVATQALHAVQTVPAVCRSDPIAQLPDAV